MIKNTLIGLGIFVSACSPAVAQEPIILDHYKTIIDQKPYHVEVCSDVSTSGDKSGDMLKGAIIGGILGNNVGDIKNGGAAGAIIGGMIGHNNSTATGGTKTVCQLETRYDEEQVSVYSHSVIKFEYNNRVYTTTFKK